MRWLAQSTRRVRKSPSVPGLVDERENDLPPRGTVRGHEASLPKLRDEPLASLVARVDGDLQVPARGDDRERDQLVGREAELLAGEQDPAEVEPAVDGERRPAARL